jgi:hypothetical protein
VPTLALDTYENIVLPGNRDPVVRDVTLPTATSFHVNATTQNSQIRVEVENNCQRPAGASGRLTDQPNVNLYMVDQTAASTGPWRISVELRAGNTDTDATLFVETGTSCRSFASIKAGAGAALFCDGVVADTKMVSLRDTAVVLDNQAKLSFGFFDAVRPAGAAGTCQQASKDFVCNFMFPGCTTDGFQDRSAQCREDCEAHVTSCYDELCTTSVCSRLNPCSTTTGIPGTPGTPGTSGTGTTGTTGTTGITGNEMNATSGSNLVTTDSAAPAASGDTPQETGAVVAIVLAAVLCFLIVAIVAAVWLAKDSKSSESSPEASTSDEELSSNSDRVSSNTPGSESKFQLRGDDGVSFRRSCDVASRRAAAPALCARARVRPGDGREHLHARDGLRQHRGLRPCRRLGLRGEPLRRADG